MINTQKNMSVKTSPLGEDPYIVKTNSGDKLNQL